MNMEFWLLFNGDGIVLLLVMKVKLWDLVPYFKIFWLCYIERVQNCDSNGVFFQNIVEERGRKQLIETKMAITDC